MLELLWAPKRRASQPAVFPVAIHLCASKPPLVWQLAGVLVVDRGCHPVQVCHSYEMAEVCEQAAVMGHLGERKFPGACAALPMIPAHVTREEQPYVTSTPSKGTNIL